MLVVIHDVVLVVKHLVDVDEQIHVEVDVTFVIQAVIQLVVEVVRHCVEVELHMQVEVDV